jgi:hypothetical protein
MGSDVGTGDSEQPYLDVAPADNSTQVTLTVTAPGGAVTDVTMTGGPLTPIDGSTDQQQRWTAAAPVTYDRPGTWVLHFDVTGTGEGAEDLDVYVVSSPTAGGPTWLPGRSRVATYVPHRTLARSTTSTVTSADTYVFSFDSTTVPTGIQVDRLIADGAAWVAGRVGALNTTLDDMASVVVALYAAAAVERSWPSDDQSLQRANDMEKRMDAMFATLAAANEATTGTGDYGVNAVVPAWCFPPADPRWDYARYW